MMGMGMRGMVHGRRRWTMVMIMMAVLVVVHRRRHRSGRTIGYVRGLPLSRNFSFDIFECISPIRVKIWMTESPALREKFNIQKAK